MGGGGGGCEKGGGGELSRMCLKPCLPTCGKKNTGMIDQYLDFNKS